MNEICLENSTKKCQNITDTKEKRKIKKRKKRKKKISDESIILSLPKFTLNKEIQNAPLFNIQIKRGSLSPNLKIQGVFLKTVIQKLYKISCSCNVGKSEATIIEVKIKADDEILANSQICPNVTEETIINCYGSGIISADTIISIEIFQNSQEPISVLMTLSIY